MIINPFVFAGGSGPPGGIDPDRWFAADEITGLSDTDPVATWPDLASGGNDATQSNASYRPTYATTGFNGLPKVVFSGTRKNLLMPALASGAVTLVAVAARKSSTENLGQLWRTNDGAGSNAGSLSGGSKPGLSTGPGFYWQGDAFIDFTVVHPVATATVTSFVLDGASSLARLDGEQRASGDPGSVDFTTGVAIGNNQNESIEIDVAEMLWYQGALTTGQLEGVESDLASKWGITLA